MGPNVTTDSPSLWVDGGDLEGDLATARDGNPDALGRVLTSFLSELTTLAKRAVLTSPALRRYSAEDIVQDILTLACRDFTSFRGRILAEFRGWLLAIGRNVVRERIRAGRTKARDPKSEIDLAAQGFERDPLDTLPSDATTPGRGAMRREEQRALALALAKLTSEERQIVAWSGSEGLPFKEIGRRLSIGEDAARKRHARILLKLHRELGPGHEPR